MPVTRSQMNNLLRGLEGPTRRAFERAIRAVKGKANLAALEAAIVAGDIDAVMAATGMHEGVWSGLTEAVRSAYAQAGAFVVAADVPRRLRQGLEFNINNPRAETWLRQNSSRMIRGDALGGGLLPEQRKAVQVVLQAGMVQGDNPRTVALDIVGRISTRTGRRMGGVIGLTEPQAQWVKNAAQELAALDPNYLTRKLRDKRFDAMVKKAIAAGQPLPAAQRRLIVGRYSDRLLKHRGDTVGRTEALRALNAANDEALRQAVEEGLAPVSAVKRVWHHSLGKNERPGHLQLNKDEKGLDEPFVNPITRAVLKYPHDEDADPSETINCRCWVEHKIDFAAVAKVRIAERTRAEQARTEWNRFWKDLQGLA